MTGKKSISTKRFLETHKYCCFCGGHKLAKTRDHIPSRSVFNKKSRPQGLEFPACLKYNRSTQKQEIIFSLLTRITVNSETVEMGEFSGLLKKAMNNFPKLVNELNLKSTPRAVEKIHFPVELHGGGLVHLNGPIVSKSIELVGNKIAKALHYEFTGNILPSTGGIKFKMFTNVDAYRKEIPDLFKHFEEHYTLRQGKWNVKNQFMYSARLVPTNDAGMYMTTFRSAFMLLFFIYEDASKMPTIN